MSRRAMLIPKPSRRPRFIPALPDYELDHLIGKLAPPERKALAQICETADLLTVDERPWLLVPADPKLLDTLAVFGAEAEDRENDLENERDDRDNDNALDFAMDRGVPVVDDGDREPNSPRERRGYIEDRQLPGRAYGGIVRDRYNASKNWDEQCKAEAFVERASSPPIGDAPTHQHNSPRSGGAFSSACSVSQCQAMARIYLPWRSSLPYCRRPGPTSSARLG